MGNRACFFADIINVTRCSYGHGGHGKARWDGGVLVDAG